MNELQLLSPVSPAHIWISLHEVNMHVQSRSDAARRSLVVVSALRRSRKREESNYTGGDYLPPDDGALFLVIHI